jgi:hypothetical protein
MEKAVEPLRLHLSFSAYCLVVHAFYLLQIHASLSLACYIGAARIGSGGSYDGISGSGPLLVDQHHVDAGGRPEDVGDLLDEAIVG